MPVGLLGEVQRAERALVEVHGHGLRAVMYGLQAEWRLLEAGVDGDLGDESALADDVWAQVARVEQFFLQDAHRVDI